MGFKSASVNTSNSVKFSIGDIVGYIIMIYSFSYLINFFIFRISATLFLNPMDLVKKRIPMNGIERATREHKTSFLCINNYLS
jgi:hypothetical protein